MGEECNVNNSTFINRYFAVPHDDRHYGNLLSEDGVLFSHGRHFPMAVPIPGGWLLNGDRYSVTTTQHQNDARSAARRHGGQVCIIPFSALHEAIPETGHNYRWTEDFKLIDITEDETQEVPYTDEDGQEQIRYEHLLGSTLFEYQGDYFLSSTDPSGKWGRNYFLTKLTRAASTVADAYESLKPGEVRDAEREGIAGRASSVTVTKNSTTPKATTRCSSSARCGTSRSRTSRPDHGPSTDGWTEEDTMRKADIFIRDEGTIIVLSPATKRGQAWMDDNIQAESWQWMGGGLCVDHRMAQDIIDGMTIGGLGLAQA